MKYLRIGFAAAFLSLIYMLPAEATSYIDVSATGYEETAVRGVWDDSVRIVGVLADEEFQITVTESNPNSIVTCWIYLDGTTTTGTTRDFTLEDYRTHYGCVVILYSNDTYEQCEFHVQALWLHDEPTPGAMAPTNISLPPDQTAASMIAAVAANDPDGPTEQVRYCACHEEMCADYFGCAWECSTNSNPDPEDCPDGDMDCVDKW